MGPGSRFGDRYEIIALLGRGGMGSVYRARHLGLGKEVALKVLGRIVVPDQEVRFEREARATARLDHPGCVRVLDYGLVADRQYLAMEFLDGPTLATALNGGRFPAARAVRVTRNLLAALAHAHGHDVLHRDVKPENVMLVAGRTVLIDFGLARLRDDAAVTARGMCIGSPSYLAPERLAGRPYDARADLYAMGVLLYEMVAGERPFGRGRPEEIAWRCLHRPPRPLRALLPEVSRELEAVIACALAKDPDRRFADAEAMLSALDEVPVDEPGVESVATAREPAASTTIVRLELDQPSRAARLWSWLWFGRWRWAR